HVGHHVGRVSRARRTIGAHALHDDRGHLDQPAERDGQDVAQHADPVLTWPSTATPSPSALSCPRSCAPPVFTTGTGSPPSTTSSCRSTWTTKPAAPRVSRAPSAWGT